MELLLGRLSVCSGNPCLFPVGTNKKWFLGQKMEDFPNEQKEKKKKKKKKYTTHDGCPE